LYAKGAKGAEDAEKNQTVEREERKKVREGRREDMEPSPRASPIRMGEGGR